MYEEIKFCAPNTVNVHHTNFIIINDVNRSILIIPHKYIFHVVHYIE